jgi:hypothetical protein
MIAGREEDGEIERYRGKEKRRGKDGSMGLLIGAVVCD